MKILRREEQETMSRTCEVCKKTVDNLRILDNYWDDPKECCLDCARTERQKSKARKFAGCIRRELKRRWERENTTMPGAEYTPTEFGMFWDHYCEDALKKAENPATVGYLEDEYEYYRGVHGIHSFQTKEMVRKTTE